MNQRGVIAGDGVRIAYDDHGPAGGRPIVLVHGLAAQGWQFADDARYFAEKGFRVLVPDLRGHGQSGRPKTIDPAGFTIALMAADMIAMLEDAGVGPVDWVGNSLGGILGLELLKTEAGRFRSLATFGTAHALNLPGIAASAIPAGYRLLGRGLISRLGGIGTTRNKAARPLIAKMLHDFDPNVGRAIAENVRRYDLLENALSYPGPMLLMRGGLDRQVNMALRATLPAFEGRANFTLVELAEAGHCANLDAPAAVRDALERFWARV
jgi:pimeloyl-ACP methyl ester carboxylesterase